MLKLGIIGTGTIAREHAHGISMIHGSAKIIAASDVDAERLDNFCDSFQVPLRYKDSAELIANPDISLVVITAPPRAHEPLAVSALNAGKYVFCEKPLAHSLESALRITQAAASHSGRCIVGHQLRYDPMFCRLLWLCRKGWIGKIRSALVERHSYIPRPNHGKTDWWGSWGVAGGGVLITQLIHEIDLLLLAMGRPVSVTAIMNTRYTGIESEDYVEATIRFLSGASARCVASLNSGCLGGRFAIHGSSGTVELPWRFTTTDSRQVSRAIRDLDHSLPDTRPESSSLISRGSRVLARHLGVRPKPTLTLHARLYQEIADNIQRGKPLPISPAEALGALELCFAAYESAITGTEVTLPLNSTSAVFTGITKGQYDARKCERNAVQRQASSAFAHKKKSVGAVRVGLIGLDTTHAPTFTSILHDPNNPFHIPGARVVAAYAGGSPDMPISISRVHGFTAELKNSFNIPIVDTPEEVAEACDLIFILASDGRTHPSLLRRVASYAKPVFLDKPIAISVSDAREIFGIAKETGTHVFASSSFRYADALVEALVSIRSSGESIRTCTIKYWLQIQETQGRYFWYGIHAAEMLLAIMGRGVREVEATSNAGDDYVFVSHDDGRESVMQGSTRDGTFHVTIETEKRELSFDMSSSMPSLSARVLWAALDVLTNGNYPRLWSATSAGSVCGPRPGRRVDPEPAETMEIVRVLDAAQSSHTSHRRVLV